LINPVHHRYAYWVPFVPLTTLHRHRPGRGKRYGPMAPVRPVGPSVWCCLH